MTADRQWGFIEGTLVELLGNWIYIVPLAGTLWLTVKVTKTSTFFWPILSLFWDPKT